MRSTKELLQLTLNEGNENFQKGKPGDVTYCDGYKGLCGFICVHLFETKKLITEVEYELLEQYIKDNEPQNPDGFLFYWPPSEWKPRQLWLKKQIKKL